jgi:hypothetical protein
MMIRFVEWNCRLRGTSYRDFGAGVQRENEWGMVGNQDLSRIILNSGIDSLVVHVHDHDHDHVGELSIGLSDGPGCGFIDTDADLLSWFQVRGMASVCAGN